MATAVQNKWKTAIFSEESRAVSMFVLAHAYSTQVLELCGFEITAAAPLHLLHCCLEHYWAASGPHLVLWAVWTSTKASSTGATDNMAMHKADSSSLRVVAYVTKCCRGLNNALLCSWKLYVLDDLLHVWCCLWVHSCDVWESFWFGQGNLPHLTGEE